MVKITKNGPKSTEIGSKRLGARNFQAQKAIG